MTVVRYRVNAWDALQNPSRDVSVIGPSGALFKERFELWPADQDMVLFRGEAGRQIYDLSRFNAESGCPYALVTRSDFQIQSNAGQVDCVDRSDEWSLYLFPRGLPTGFEVKLDGTSFWLPGCAAPKAATLPGSFFGSAKLRRLPCIFPSTFPLGGAWDNSGSQVFALATIKHR